MKLKSKGLLAVLLILSLILVGCGDSAENDTGVDEKIKVGFITDTNGLGDQAFNDAAHSGVKKAAEEFDLDLKVVESREIADYASSMRTLADEGIEIIVLPSGSFEDTISQVAPEYPNVKFLLFDVAVDNFDNVRSIVFKEEEAGFILGSLAGLISETNKVGYIGGTVSPVQERAMSGFKAGFKTTNNNGTVTSIYSGTYSDVGKGKEIALSLFNQGADYVAAFTGSGNLGVFQAAEEKGEGFYALGAATGQFGVNPDKIVGSQVKTIDLAIYKAIKDTLEGNFVSGSERWGIKEGGVDLLLNNVNEELVNKLVSEEDLNVLDNLREMIENEEITIPLTEEEYESFTPPQ